MRRNNMKEKEYGKRFSEDCYATKDEVKAVFNLDNITNIWDDIIAYRNYFVYETPMRDNEGNHYQMCLNRSILSTCYKIEKLWIRDLTTFNSLSLAKRDAYILNKKIHVLRAVSKTVTNTNITNSTLQKIALHQIETIPTNLVEVDLYSRCLDSLSSIKLGAPEDIIIVNNSLQGVSAESRPVFRSEDDNTGLSHLVFPKAAESYDRLAELIEFLNDEEIPVVARCLGTIYFFEAVQPFEYLNQETASLVCKAFLYKCGLSPISNGIDIESIAFSHSEGYYAKLREIQNSLDLTYVITSSLPYLFHDEQEMANLLEETRNNDDIKEETISPSVSQETPSIDQEGSLALPSFRKEDDVITVDERARKLREIYPYLKEKEAHFYAGHCQVGLYYTIEQFKKAEKTVYETARTSMDDLANRGFYRKEKNGKKFTYTPIPLDHPI